MGRLLDRLKAGSPSYAVEPTQEGFVLVAESHHRDEFDDLVRDLMATSSDEFVVIPVSDGSVGYERAVILPL